MDVQLRAVERTVVITAGETRLSAILGIPRRPLGTVVFAHGSHSGRLSPRNNSVAHALQDAGLVTLLADLLTESESEDRSLVFDIEFLANRLLLCTKWVQSRPELRRLPVGYFGASTGAGAALLAAATCGNSIGAIVSRGGRPDLAGDRLEAVQAPTLLLAGGNDTQIIELNEQSLERLSGEKELVIVPGAGHLFEEPGTLEEVARLARQWFVSHLSKCVGSSMVDR
ncbi:MAG: dienelactone hydrolase family protein [Chloroflexota bacterium]